MLQLVTPPEHPRPALLASIGIHALAASAFGFVPLLAFPIAPGWQGEVWVVTQPDLSLLRDVKTVDLRGPGRQDRPPRGPAGGGLTAARREGPPAAPSAPTVQPTSMIAELPPAPEFEPSEDSDYVGRVDEEPGSERGGGIRGGVPDGPIDVRGGGAPPDIVLPVPLETPTPRYPDTARIARMEGAVVLSATIAADGRVVDVEIERSMGPFLDRAALDAVSRWRYVPARIGPTRVAVILRVTLTFRLL
ncbi:MAG: TonB family protein [Holophagales bacterium]|nr:TonB family protein [Holophagales bacterium]